MEEYYERYWKNEINAGVMNKPPIENISRTRNMLIKVRRFLKGECLDVGCGDGSITSELNKIIPTIGLDVSEVAIRKARKKYPHIKFIKGDVTNLPFGKKHFGCVFASELIEHVQDTNIMFSEFNRVLSENGCLIMTTPELTFLKNVFIALFYWNKYYNPANPHIRFYSKKSLGSILKKFGFKIIHYEHDGEIIYGIPKGMMVVAKKMRQYE